MPTLCLDGLGTVNSLSAATVGSSLLDLAIVLPTYNELENIPLIIARLTEALQGLAWEAIFVDDDSPDGTSEAISTHACEDSRIRLIHRVGRRGLASASIEGMMATQAPFIAVMDADLQHDESILPRMLTRLRRESLDLVVGTRNAEGGGMGEFGHGRVLLSRMGQRISHAVCRCNLTDPMSGFFMLRRNFLLEVVRDLHGGGFKILVDLLASVRRPVLIGEVGYTFRMRGYGESKLNVVVGIEYLFLIANKLLGGIIPTQLTLYLLVGGLGLAAHLTSLLILTQIFHIHFVAAQAIATFIAMTENFFLNNLITFRDRRLRGAEIVPGAVRFVLTCSFGAWANVVFARALWQSGAEWCLAGFAGIVLGSVWNLSISSLITWETQRRSIHNQQMHEAFATDLGVSR
ncbi:MAG: glycosyl transferase [Acidobacteriaceae bacterium]|nr:glycosyl transferase [Acidobacteriaceae bacterium]